jgi:hypothetical protein
MKKQKIVYIVFSEKQFCIVAVFSKKQTAETYVKFLDKFNYKISEQVVI